jgi:hypothetical protein
MNRGRDWPVKAIVILIAILVALALNGCAKAMTADQYNQAVAACKAKGMDPWPRAGGVGFAITSVDCRPDDTLGWVKP